MQITPLQKMALLGMMARDREIQRATLELQVDNRELLSLIERDADLAPGSLGTTHDVDLQAGTITERQQPIPIREDAS